MSGAFAAAVLIALAACGPSAEPVASPSASSSVDVSPSAEPSASPTPTPDPTRPALAELALSADGLGPLALGSPPDDGPETSLVSFEPEGCTDAVTGEDWGIGPADPGAELWRTDPEYSATEPAYGPGSAFGVGVDRDTGVVNRVDLYSADVPTDGGVRIGDPGSSIAPAHPDATIVPEYLTDIHVVEGALGTLQIEVAKNPPDMEGDYWEGRAGTVVYIHAVTIDLGVFTVAASGNLVGVCGA